METKNNECFRCKQLNRYYIKGNKQFNKIEFGWCCKNKKNVSIHNTCESFIKKPKPQKVKHYVWHYLDQLLTEITEIRNIIEEEINEINENEKL